MVKKILAGFVGIIAVLAVIMAYTSPQSVHPGVLLLFFALIYVASILGIFLLAYVVARIVRIQHSNQSLFRISSVLALAPVVLLALNSIGTLTAQSIILVVIFVSIAGFYLWRQA